ncbi:protein GET4 [Magnolia sinica]|uniref:protein GET4 n=1 Tax=Magnolia sinica TaxID=86752 RepID=UPI00265AA45D|nr:protein GET4 [Magnolia sinica]
MAKFFFRRDFGWVWFHGFERSGLDGAVTCIHNHRRRRKHGNNWDGFSTMFKEDAEVYWSAKNVEGKSDARSETNIEKLEKTVNDGNYYEAQQMYKSVSARYVAAERCAEALDILQSGASIQLRNGQIPALNIMPHMHTLSCPSGGADHVLALAAGQRIRLVHYKVGQKVTCGSELAVLFVETLIKGKFQCSEETLDRVRKIYQEFPRITLPHHLGDEDDDEMQQLSEAMVAAKTRVEGCSSFLKAAIRWSAEFGASRNGSPELHDMLAEYFYTESPEMDMARVSFHFVRGSNPEKFAAKLVNFMGKCYPGEDDLAIARAILMYLSLGNLRDANCLMDELKIQLKSKQLDFPKSDLIQFIVYVVKTLERDALPLFRILRQNYKLSIERDPAFDELLDEIAEKFYGIKRRSGLQGMFGDIFNV